MTRNGSRHSETLKTAFSPSEASAQGYSGVDTQHFHVPSHMCVFVFGNTFRKQYLMCRFHVQSKLLHLIPEMIVLKASIFNLLE